MSVTHVVNKEINIENHVALFSDNAQ